MMDRPSNEDFFLKMSNRHVREVTGGKLPSIYEHDLVEQMIYLYVRVVKARNLPATDITGSCDLYAEVRLGNYKGITRAIEKKLNPEWNNVFAFSRDRIQATMLEVSVKDKDFVKDDFIGLVLFDLTEVPKRVPPDSPLAPQWYRLEDRKGNKIKGEVMLAVWGGTQADEAYSEAWHADDLAKNRSKVYLSPKLWYLRVNVIEAQVLIPIDRTRFPEVFVKASLGHQTLRTRISMSKSTNPMWNEDLMFVAAEPFEEGLILSVEDRIAPNNAEVLGTCAISLRSVERRIDDKEINTRTFNLKKHVGDLEKKDVKFAIKLCMRICLEGGYHVLDESTHYISDLRPSARQLQKNSIGVLEVGILRAHGLSPMKTKDGRERTDAYCVAKYGEKWVRTRTIRDSCTPKWNEQYAWEVFDPCTVITIGVFDNCQPQGEVKAGGARDSMMGKVRIRLSTLETGCVYYHAYPLFALHASGVKKTGEILLAVRFTCSLFLNMIQMYSQPLLPEMHDIHPLNVTQLDSLMKQATQIVSMRLSQAEPPLRKEVVEYMLDVGSHRWSMRRSKANVLRIMGVLGGLIAVLKWFDQIRNWKDPLATVVVHIVFIMLVLYPEFILPSVFLSLFLIGIWNRRWRPKHPPHMDTHLSFADYAHPDELDEEFDTFPTSRDADVVRMRYDRLRSVGERMQTVAGDLATQGERLQSLLSWRDPIATTLFVILCLIVAIVVYAKPLYVVVIQTGFCVLSHPRFQHKLPLVPLNFFRRLPARSDCML